MHRKQYIVYINWSGPYFNFKFFDLSPPPFFIIIRILFVVGFAVFKFISKCIELYIKM